MNFALFLLQLVIILAASFVVGKAIRRIGQPNVVGEIIAGLLLGPSFLGWLAPSLSARLFPVESLGFLNVVSQIGLVLFMFLVGLKIEVDHLWRERGVALVAAASSILTPFIASVLLGLYLHPHLSSQSLGALPFVLFLGASMSITAFPVLARILAQQDLFATRLGTIALFCAAVDDVSSWMILAAVVSLIHREHPIGVTVVLFGTYLLLMLLVVRPILRRLQDSNETVRAVALLLLLG